VVGLEGAEGGASGRADAGTGALDVREGSVSVDGGFTGALREVLDILR
jgi:hypothetical protein